MNIVYFAPRYHTNQIPIMKGWIEAGETVHFVSQYKGKTEDYTVLTPNVLGYSSFFCVIEKIYELINGRNKNKSNIEYFQTHYGFPSGKKLKKLLNNLMPDLLILRDRSFYNMRVYNHARKRKIPCILYNQTPYWETEKRKNDIFHRIVRENSPEYRMTPVYGNETKGKAEKKSYYVPFVMEPIMEPKTVDNQLMAIEGEKKVRILCIGKYETRKNQLMLLKVFKELQKTFSIELSFVGEVSTSHHKDYLGRIEKFISENELGDNVIVQKNLNRQQVFEEYRRADLFVLPSTKEFASISQLEAMACSLPVICSDTNGTACYIEEGINGYLFTDNDETSLQNMMRNILDNKEKLKEMGENSFQLILNKYNFEEYKKMIYRILEDIEKEMTERTIR